VEKIKKRRTLSKILYILCFLLIPVLLTTTIGGCATVQTKEIKDEINNLSFSHDGKKVIFDRCRNRDCQIQVYDLETGELAAYKSPSNEQWTMGKYSDDGKKIVFSIFPADKKYIDLTQMQIGVIDVDGQNFKKLTSSPFPKIYPTFSHSGKKVLYVKAGRIRKQGRTPAGDYDAWEVDVATGKETRLTYFEYMSMNSLFYFPDDERFLYQADDPFAFPGLEFPKDNEGRFKDIETAMKMIDQESEKRKVPLFGILTMKKGDLFPQRTYSLFKEGHPPISPLLSKDGTKLFFEAAGEAGALYLYSSDGNHKFIVRGGSVDSWALSPDGGYLGINYRSCIFITRISDGMDYRSIFLRRFKNWEEGVRKNSGLRLMPDQALRIINR
jgi:hypothetical protein